jgi:hypothetical protein
MAPRCVRACLGCRPVFRSLAASLLFHLLLRCFFDLLPFCLWFAVLCVGRLDPEAQTLGGGGYNNTTANNLNCHNNHGNSAWMWWAATSEPAVSILDAVHID